MKTVIKKPKKVEVKSDTKKLKNDLRLLDAYVSRLSARIVILEENYEKLIKTLCIKVGKK